MGNAGPVPVNGVLLVPLLSRWVFSDAAVVLQYVAGPSGRSASELKLRTTTYLPIRPVLPAG